MNINRFYCPHCGEQIRFSDTEPIITNIERELKDILEELESSNSVQIIEYIEETLQRIEARLHVLENHMIAVSENRPENLQRIPFTIHRPTFRDIDSTDERALGQGSGLEE